MEAFIKMKGVIRTRLDDGNFIVDLENGNEILIIYSSKHKEKFIFLEGDEIIVKYNPYDIKKGAIHRDSFKEEYTNVRRKKADYEKPD